jgi:DNA-binding MarR family transcriptional regulator
MTRRAENLDELVHAVRGVFFALRGMSETLLSDLDCTAGERSLLQELEARGPQSVPVLARSRAVSRQAMQKTVDGLRARGWLDAIDNPQHQRSSLVALTPSGRKVFTAIRARELEWLASVKLPVRAAELRQATDVLQLLGRLFATARVPTPRPPGGRRGVGGRRSQPHAPPLTRP